MKRTIALLTTTALLGAAAATADHLNISADGITTNGAEVTIESVLIDKPGFVVLHEIKDGAPVVPASIGNAYVEAGESADVTITADMELTDGADYIAMLHYDTDGDGSYSFGEGMTDVDGPATNAEGNPYVVTFTAGGGMM
jgi:hypothetical protein